MPGGTGDGRLPPKQTAASSSFSRCHSRPTRAWRAHGRTSLWLPVWGLQLPFCIPPTPPSCQLASGRMPHFGAWLPLSRVPWHSPRSRERRGEGGLVQAGWHRQAEARELEPARSASAAGRVSPPSLCSLPNESSRATPKLEGEGHSFIYITQEI